MMSPLPPIPWDTYKSMGNLKAIMREFGIKNDNPPDLCPFHNDTKEHPSFNWFTDKDGFAHWMCMSHCGSGDIYDFVGLAYGLKDKAEQFDYVSRKFGGEGLQLKNRKCITGPVVKSWEPKPPKERVRDLNAELSVQKFMEDHPDRDSEVRKYLRDRGFNNEFVIDYMADKLLYWPGYEEALQAFGDKKLYAAGIPGKVKGAPSKWDRPGVVCVLPVGWKLRYLDENGKRQKMGSLGSKTFLIPDDLPSEITFVEGDIDKLAMDASGFRGVFACGKTTLEESNIYDIIKRNPERINVLLDGDDPGKMGSGFLPGKDGTNSRSLPGKFRSLGYKGNLFCVPIAEEQKDPAEMVSRNETTALADLLKNAVRFEDIKFPEVRDINTAVIPEYDGDTSIQHTEFVQNSDWQKEDGSLQWPFRFLGVKDNTHFFISRSQEVFAVPSKSITSNSFLTIAPLEFWQSIKVNSRGSPDWEFLTNLVIEHSIMHGSYKPENIRGTGIWKDEDEIVFSDGLKVHSKTRGVHVVSRFPTKNNIYVMSTDMGLVEKQEDAEQQKEDLEMINWITQVLSFKTPEHGKLLFGWIVASLFLSILDWRPIAYMKGPTSVGKSWTMNHVVRPMLYKISINPKNSSTLAGLMQAPGFNAQMITIDELEGSNSQKGNELIKEFIKLARDTSSNSGERKYIGTADQTGMSREFASMFLFASIVESASEDQDVNRITAIEFAKKENKISWEEISQKIMLAFRNGLAERIRGDIIYHRETVYKNIKMFGKAAAGILKTQRNADQMGTLIGGWYYFVAPGKEATLEEASALIKTFDTSEQDARSNGNTMKTIMGCVFGYKIRYEDNTVDRVAFRERTVYDILTELQMKGPNPGTKEFLNQVLMSYGLRYGHPKYPGCLVMACNHEKIKSMLPRNFSYLENYKDYFKNHPDCKGTLNSVKFLGTVYMALAFRIDFSEDEETPAEYTDKIPF